MKDSFFKQLDKDEEEEFRNWARENYTPFSEIKEVWHPVVRDECKNINRQVMG
jgi:hypothetical protein